MKLRFGLKLCFLLMLALSVAFALLRPRPEVFEFYAFVQTAGASETVGGSVADLGAVILPRPGDTDFGNDSASIAVELSILDVQPAARDESHDIYGRLCRVRANVPAKQVALMRLALETVPSTLADLDRFPDSRLVLQVRKR